LICEALGMFEALGIQRGVAECVHAAGAVMVAEGDAATGARLFGAAERMMEDVGAELWPADAHERERDLAALKEAMAEEDAERELAAGRAMANEEAVRMACPSRQEA
jgi:hypothetical protein